MTILSIISTYKTAFLQGLQTTIELTVLSCGIGISGGLFLGILAYKWPGSLGKIVGGFSFILGSLPLLVFMYWLHYPLQELLGVVINPFITATFIFSIVNLIGVANLMYSALRRFPRQHKDSADACGLSSRLFIVRILFPLTFREVIPGLVMLQMQVVQMTLFASLISVNELFRVAQRINATIYQPIPIYTALAVFFLAVCVPLHMGARILEKRFSNNLSER